MLKSELEKEIGRLTERNERLVETNLEARENLTAILTVQEPRITNGWGTREEPEILTWMEIASKIGELKAMNDYKRLTDRAFEVIEENQSLKLRLERNEKEVKNDTKKRDI